jgi:hypothetical protein
LAALGIGSAKAIVDLISKVRHISFHQFNLLELNGDLDH